MAELGGGEFKSLTKELSGNGKSAKNAAPVIVPSPSILPSPSLESNAPPTQDSLPTQSSTFDTDATSTEQSTAQSLGEGWVPFTPREHPPLPASENRTFQEGCTVTVRRNGTNILENDWTVQKSTQMDLPPSLHAKVGKHVGKHSPQHNYKN